MTAKINWDGIAWIGVVERCDQCGEEYPLAWIEFDGARFLCLACRADNELAANDPTLP